ncbi:CAAX amino terminal protease family protein, partial [Trifolium medium]|nr:CAAX amino terminal protease family protein [Trifolium medium]
ELEEEVSDNQSNIITSLAEKAMSVAGPVVPTKEDGGVDQDRLVAMLADLGQRGGLLRLVGKFALLWGGIRGAMSLTDKLISFFHFSERPLFQR